MPGDVVIEIKFAGICHSDIHTAREEWGPIQYPLVPGHEIGGFVTEVASDVTKFKVGDCVGVGCMVDSCRGCNRCEVGEEQYCSTGFVGTYNGKQKYPHCSEYTPEGGAISQGGYSQFIVVNQNFVLNVPTNLDLAAATPLLCAGITTYSPLRKFGLAAGQNFAVLGLGGLGHMGAKFGKAFGAKVTVFSRGTSKKESALKLGADAFIDSTNEAEMASLRGSFDFILDTIAAPHDINSYLGMLKPDGKMILVGAPPEPLSVQSFNLIFGRKTLSGSLIGGIKETQEMLDFCGQHNITCDIELIDATRINEAYDRTMASDVKYRFVIDTSTL